MNKIGLRRDASPFPYREAGERVTHGIAENENIHTDRNGEVDFGLQSVDWVELDVSITVVFS